MGCCPSRSTDGDDPDAPRAVKKEGKAKILTTEPSDLEKHVERECKLKGRKAPEPADQELMGKGEASTRTSAMEKEGASEEDSSSGVAVVEDAAAEAEEARRKEEEAAAAEAAEQVRREAEEKARIAAEEKAKRDAEEQAKRVASLKAAIGNTMTRAAAKAPTRVQSLATAARLQLDDKAALSAFTRYEDQVQQAATQLTARMPILARLMRGKGEPGNLATLLSMEEHTRNAQFMAVMHAGATSSEHMTHTQAWRCPHLANAAPRRPPLSLRSTIASVGVVPPTSARPAPHTVSHPPEIPIHPHGRSQHCAPTQHTAAPCSTSSRGGCP